MILQEELFIKHQNKCCNQAIKNYLFSETVLQKALMYLKQELDKRQNGEHCFLNKAALLFYSLCFLEPMGVCY
jgi:hypothetical protein